MLKAHSHRKLKGGWIKEALRDDQDRRLRVLAAGGRGLRQQARRSRGADQPYPPAFRQQLNLTPAPCVRAL